MKNMRQGIKKNTKKTFSKASLKAFAVSLLFIFSSIGASVLINPVGAVPDSSAALASTPLSAAQANWVGGNANKFNWAYNPQNLINSSNAQYLGISWLFPVPENPQPLLSVGGNHGVDTSPLIINGTIYAVTQAGQAFALNAATGNLIWNRVLQILPNSTAGLSARALSIHLHDGNEWFTTKWHQQATWWISAIDDKVYALSLIHI